MNSSGSRGCGGDVCGCVVVVVMCVVVVVV